MAQLKAAVSSTYNLWYLAELWEVSIYSNQMQLYFNYADYIFLRNIIYYISLYRCIYTNKIKSELVALQYDVDRFLEKSQRGHRTQNHLPVLTSEAERGITRQQSQDLWPAQYELLLEMNRLGNTTFSLPFQLPPCINYQLRPYHLEVWIPSYLSFSKAE